MDPLGDVTVVVPTIGRPSLDALLSSLAAQPHLPGRIVVVDDGREPTPVWAPPDLGARIAILRSGGRGPAAARNLGWRAASTPWVVFLDDDVVVTPRWSIQLAGDLQVADDIGAVQATITVPRPVGRRLTDNERNTAALEEAPWITADLAVRRAVLDEVAGFDERFPRAYREDSDFALRAQDAGWRFTHGARVTEHPMRADPWWASVAAQRGNRDDALMRALHGPDWSATRGRRRRHVVVTVAGFVALLAAACRARQAAAVCGVAWAAGTLELATARIRDGNRAPGEITAMLATSVVIPPLAVWHWSAGRLRWRRGVTTTWPEVHRTAGR